MAPFHISLSRLKVYTTDEARQFCSERCSIESQLFRKELDETPPHLRPKRFVKSATAPFEKNIAGKPEPAAHESRSSDSEIEEMLSSMLHVDEARAVPPLSRFGVVYSTLGHWCTEDSEQWLRGTFGNTPQYEKRFSEPTRDHAIFARQQKRLPSLLQAMGLDQSVERLLNQLIATFSLDPIDQIEQLDELQWDVVFVVLLRAISRKHPLNLAPFDCGCSEDELNVFLDIFWSK